MLNDWFLHCEDRGIASKINHTHHLERELKKHFPDSIGFFKTGKYVIVYSQFTNPCEYSVNTLLGKGMRDKDILLSFANMVKRKINQQFDVTQKKCPFSHKDLVEETKRGPIKDLYNIIYMTLYDVLKVNEHGYAITNSKNIGTKIWSMANDWEALILRGSHYRNPKQVLMGINIYGLTRSKQLINYLNKSNVCISYKDITTQNKYWEEMVKNGESCTTILKKRYSYT